MTLNGLTAMQAIALPVVLGLMLMVLLRRTAHPIVAVAALLFGGWGAMRLTGMLLSRLPSVLPEGQLLASTPAQAWESGLLEAAIPEEVAKGIIMAVFILAARRIYGTRTGPLLGGMVGLGFALFENLMYAMTEPGYRVMAVLSHGSWGIILGWLLQQAMFAARLKPLKVLLAFIPTIMLHGLMDALIFLMDVLEVRYGADLAAEDIPASALLTALGLVLGSMLISIGELAWATVIVWRTRRESGRHSPCAVEENPGRESRPEAIESDN